MRSHLKFVEIFAFALLAASVALQARQIRELSRQCSLLAEAGQITTAAGKAFGGVLVEHESRIAVLESGKTALNPNDL